jgi:hypothetical protein
MAHGRRQRSQNTLATGHERLAALGRGAILGLVSSLHLALLALLFRPVMPLRAVSVGTPGHPDALRIRWVAEAAMPHRAGAAQRARHTARTPQRTLKTIAVPEATATPTPTMRWVLPPSSPGDYHSPLLGGPGGITASAPVAHLPGSDTPRAGGILLRDKPTLRQVVRALPGAIRCQYTRMKMEHSANQFVTRQLVERALDLDGCGPHSQHDAAAEAVEAISKRAIFGG